MYVVNNVNQWCESKKYVRKETWKQTHAQMEVADEGSRACHLGWVVAFEFLTAVCWTDVGQHASIRTSAVSLEYHTPALILNFASYRSHDLTVASRSSQRVDTVPPDRRSRDISRDTLDQRLENVIPSFKQSNSQPLHISPGK
jgi:hypothetical protein